MNKMYRKSRREFNASPFMMPSCNQSLMLFRVYFAATILSENCCGSFLLGLLFLSASRLGDIRLILTQSDNQIDLERAFSQRDRLGQISSQSFILGGSRTNVVHFVVKMAEKDLSPLTPSIARGLNDKLYEKRKVAALEIER